MKPREGSSCRFDKWVKDWVGNTGDDKADQKQKSNRFFKPSTYSCPCLVVAYTEELISRTFLGENQFWQVLQKHMTTQNRIGYLVFVSQSLFCFNSSTPCRFPLKLPLKLKDFPSWRPQVFVSCNKSIWTKQANPSTDTAISMGNGLVCWIKTKSDRLSTAIKI